MEGSFDRISKTLKMPQESRERIRAQLVSPSEHQEENMKKNSFKKFIPLIAAAIAVLSLTFAAAAIIVPRFRNDTIVGSVSDIPDPADNGTAPGGVGISSPNGNPPFSLEEITESDRYKSNGWLSDETIQGGWPIEYNKWDTVEVLDSDPALRSRRVTRADGAEKMEYTAENPANLIDTLTGRISFDLSWMGEHYDYVPDANFTYVTTDKKGNYVGEILEALYAKKDGIGYVRVQISNTAEAEHWAQGYIIDGSYETAYYYTSADGCEFLIKMHNGNVWVNCNTSHTTVSLYGAYLTEDEVEDILDNLSLSLPE